MKIEYLKRKLNNLPHDDHFNHPEKLDIIMNKVPRSIPSDQLIVASYVASDEWYVFTTLGIGVYHSSWIFYRYSEIESLESQLSTMLASGQTKAELDHFNLKMRNEITVTIRFKNPGLCYSVWGILNSALIE